LIAETECVMKITMKLDERSMKGPRRTGKIYRAPRTFVDRLIDALFPEVPEGPPPTHEPQPRPEPATGPDGGAIPQ
jgi:hypothetical protein